MQLFDSDPSLRWLFCMTHPDDEISICCWIRRLSLAGAHVSMSWTHDNPIRRKEAIEVAEKLGLADGNLYFHEAVDGRVCDSLVELVPRFKQMIENEKPDRIVCGAFEQGHLDHDATNWLVNASFDGPVLEVPFYHTYLTRFPRVNRFTGVGDEQLIVLTKEEAALKKDVARSYPSQRIWLNMMAAELRARLTGDGSLLRRERMRLQVHRDFRVPNVSGRHIQAIRVSAKWQRWLAALDKAEKLVNVVPDADRGW